MKAILKFQILKNLLIEKAYYHESVATRGFINKADIEFRLRNDALKSNNISINKESELAKHEILPEIKGLSRETPKSTQSMLSQIFIFLEILKQPEKHYTDTNLRHHISQMTTLNTQELSSLQSAKYAPKMLPNLNNFYSSWSSRKELENMQNPDEIDASLRFRSANRGMLFYVVFYFHKSNLKFYI